MKQKTVAEGLIESLYGFSKILVEQQSKELAPMAVLMSDGEIADVVLIPMPWKNDREKRAYLMALKKMCEVPRVRAVAIAVEAWSLNLKSKPGETLTMAELPLPRHHPDRVEVLAFTAQERGGKTWTAEAKVLKREDGKRTLAPYEKRQPSLTEGFMSNMFDEEEKPN